MSLDGVKSTPDRRQGIEDATSSESRTKTVGSEMIRLPLVSGRKKERQNSRGTMRAGKRRETSKKRKEFGKDFPYP